MFTQETLNGLEASGLRPVVIDENFDFSELDDLLKPPAPAAQTKLDELDELDELDGLLAEAKAESKLAQQVKEARARAKSGYGNTPEDQERIRKWELAREWLPVANTALFERYECQCGHHQTVFKQLMLEQVHRFSKTVTRWTAATTYTPGLPRRTKVSAYLVPMCQRCCRDQGFQLTSAE